MKTVIVVLNWNNCQATVACVESLLHHVIRPGRSLVVVDNNSTDGSVNVFNESLPTRPFPSGKFCFDEIDQQLFILRSPSNCGYAGGNNFAIQALLQAGCDFEAVWILNNDTTVENDALTPLQNTLRLCNNGGFVGSLLLNQEDDQIQCVGGVHGLPALGFFRSCEDILTFESNRRSPRDMHLSFITGASMLTSKNVIDDIGLMNDFYFLYFEEIDWQLRASRKGYEIRVSTDSRLRHAESGSVGAKSDFFFFVFSRSCVIFVTRNYSRWLSYLSAVWLLASCLVSTRSLSKLKYCIRGIQHGLMRSEFDLNAPMFHKVGANLISKI